MIFPLSSLQVFLSIVIATVGAIIQGGVGFGLGLLTVPLLIYINPAFVPGPIILASLILTILVSFRERREIKFSEMKWTMAGRILGTILGAYILTIFPAGGLSILFGIIILIAVALSISGFHLPVTNKNLVGAGTLSGVMATIAAIGGPPLAIIYQKMDGSKLRGTLAGIFFLGTLLSTLALVSIGKFGFTELRLTLIITPGILIGYLVSGRLAAFLDGGYVRTAVLFISAVSALGVIIRNLL